MVSPPLPKMPLRALEFGRCPAYREKEKGAVHASTGHKNSSLAGRVPLSLPWKIRMPSFVGRFRNFKKKIESVYL
jgi:hypothetical protein